MYCPNCNGKTTVKESRKVEMNVYRHRVCTVCGYDFYTEETEIEDTEGMRYYWLNQVRERRGKVVDK